MDKLGRNYLFTFTPAATVVDGVSVAGVPILATLPLTCEFDIVQNTLSSANVCRIRLYNLAPAIRQKIAYNQSNTGVYMAVKLQAGYGPDLTSLPTIFQGNVSQAWSVREGVNFITQIECYDGGFAYANAQTISVPIAKGEPTSVSMAKVMKAGLRDWNCSPGGVGTYTDLALRPTLVGGNTVDILKTMAGNDGFFIANEKAYCLSTNDVVVTPNPFLISAFSGLLNTPVLEQTTARFEMIFEPNLQVGTLATIKSLTSQIKNGPYKITAVKHRGMISGAVCGDAVSEGTFFYLSAFTPAVLLGP